MINERLILEEAEAQDISADEKEIDARLDRLKSQFPDEDGFYQNLMQNNITMEQAKEQIGVKILTEKLIARNAQVSDSDLQSYYDDNKSKLFGGKEFDEVKEEIRKQLAQQKIYETTQTWTEKLRENASIEIDI